MTLFDYAELGVGLLIVVGAVKPVFNKAKVTLHQARQGVQEMLRRKHSLSQQVRTLARECLHHRATSVHDHDDAERLHDVVAGLTRRVEELESVDRRILVLDERRGLRETAWILCIARSGPPLPHEPPRVTESWREGRYIFYWAENERLARNKASIRFPADHGFQVIEVLRHDGDLADTPHLSSASGAGSVKERAMEQIAEHAAEPEPVQ